MAKVSKKTAEAVGRAAIRAFEPKPVTKKEQKELKTFLGRAGDDSYSMTPQVTLAPERARRMLLYIQQLEDQIRR